MSNKIIKNISSSIPSNHSYSDIVSEIDFSNFNDAKKVNPNKKTLLKVLIPSSVAVAIIIASAIFVPNIINANKTSSLVEVNDIDFVLALSNTSSQAETIPQDPPTLDLVWSDYLEELEKYGPDHQYFCETNLHYDKYFNCYYLSSNTIKKIEELDKEDPIWYMSDNGENINYLRYYAMLLEEKRLDEDDKLMMSLVDGKEKIVKKEIGNYCLVKITKNIEIENKEFGNYFVEVVNYKEDNKNAKIDLGYPFYDIYNGAKIAFNHVPYMKNLFKSGFYPASFLYTFSYIISGNNTFETYIRYDDVLIQEDENYYDVLDSIIVDKEYITKRVYIDPKGIEHLIDWFSVVCDYSKTKELFGF